MDTGIGLYCAWRNNTFVLEDAILLKYDAVSMGSQICTLPQSVGLQLDTDAASYPRRTETSATPLLKPQNSHAGFKNWICRRGKEHMKERTAARAITHLPLTQLI